MVWLFLVFSYTLGMHVCSAAVISFGNVLYTEHMSKAKHDTIRYTIDILGIEIILILVNIYVLTL